MSNLNGERVAMTIREIVDGLGGAREVAMRMALRRNSISMWIHNGGIPLKHHTRLLYLAKERGFKVTREQLETATFEGPLAGGVK